MRVDRGVLLRTRDDRVRVAEPLAAEEVALARLDLALSRWKPTGATSRDPEVQRRLDRLLTSEPSLASVKEAVLFLRRAGGLPANEVNALMDALCRARTPWFLRGR